MTSLSAHALSHARVRRLLAAVGSSPVEPGPASPVSAHDWRKPRYFDEDQCNRLAAIVSQVAVVMGEKFAHFHTREFTVAPASITQRFAADFFEGMDAEQYCLTFGPAGEAPCGLLAVGAATARRWCGWLLGDAESHSDGARPFSVLEESLLHDFAAAVAESFLEPLRTQQGLRLNDRLTKGDPAMALEPTREVCTIVFRVGQSGSGQDDELLFMLPCSMLAPLAGKTLQPARQSPPEELSQALMEHVQRIPVTLTAKLASTRLTFEELLDLGVGDILLLDKPVDEPLELVLDGRVLFQGRAVRSDGQHAVFLTAPAAGPGQRASRSTTMR